MDSCYTRLVIADPDDPENWFQLASVRARQGRFGEADTALNRSLEGNPIRPGALFLSGWIRERLGRTGEAIGLYAHHLEAHPQDDATRRRLVTLLADAGRFSEALVHARLITAASPKDGVARQVEADLEFRAGHPEAGEQALARMRELSPDDPEGVARSVQVLARYHRVARALKLADDWSDARPTDARGLELRAWARSQANQPDSAVSWARRLVDTQPDSIGPRRLLARYLREAHRYSDAIDQIGELRRRQPGDAGLLLDLGFCREQLGDVPGAIEAGRDALGLAPDAAPALNFLGYLLADHERDLPEAEKLIRRAVEQDPDNGAYVDSMGWLLFRLGQYDRAREQLERAVALTGGDPVIHEHLGDVYAQLKMFDRARREYQLSLAGDSPNPRVKGKLDSVR
jgi:tetratricopeptide (TPR) repeat protein